MGSKASSQRASGAETESGGGDEKVAVAVRASGACDPGDVLRRVEAAICPIREPGEAWEFGLLDHA